MRKCLSVAFAVVLLVVSMYTFICGQKVYSIDKNNNILVIHSYHPGLKWTDSQNKGIFKGAADSDKRTEIFVEYLDWKNYPNQESINLKYDLMKYKYKDTDIDVIIATDDAAVEFAITYRDRLFDNAPIVFTGVSESNAEKFTANQSGITGVIEEVDIERTLELAEALYPELENIYVIYDDTESGISMGSAAMASIKERFLDVNLIESNESHVDEIVKNINNLPPSSAVLMTVFYNDKEKTIMGFKENIKYITKNTKDIPMFALYEFQMGSGVLGGSLISGEQQGRLAFEYAETILSGVDADSIPFEKTKSLTRQVDYYAMEKLGIKKFQVPEDFAIVNKPLTLLDTHYQYVYSAVIVLIFLVVFILILSYYLKRTVFLKKMLENKNRTQIELYDELAASDEELQAQFDELHTTYEELANAQEELKFIAYHDFLTKVPNKASFVKDFKKLTQDNNVKKMDIIILDIDNFKLVNDTMGHIFGDKVIQKVSKEIKKGA
ncbi:ABC transporter substrate binding protein [Proteinivorax hydrogeniformans]|uniref:ABC transporter substrate binding protein n=1 Tax=Proteinivorax hydrogeniformans TaxID=1826727 RepID=A0AAU8HUJ6_9FIRM